MQVKLAKNYGFCFGVRRAIKLAESKPNGITLGPLIHNAKEINRLKEKFNVVVNENIQEIPANAGWLLVVVRSYDQILSNKRGARYDHFIKGLSSIQRS